MFRRINWKLVFKGFAWIICLSGLIVLMSFVEVKKHSVKCTNIKILIPGADNFIEREEIDAILKQSQGQLIGRDLNGINLHSIEERIVSNPYIAFAKVYADMDGVIHIEINQRQPLLRIINVGNQDFYIDKNGLKMPVSPNFTANVLVANGSISERFNGRVDTLNTQVASDLYKVAFFIKKDTLWDAQIEQLFVDVSNDIELIPRVGNQRIILGNADSLEIKMRNLMTFYKKAMPQVGWDTYKTINIKYTNQIVCEKNKVDSLSVSTHKPAVIKDTLVSARKVADSMVHDAILKDIKDDIEEAPAAAVPAKSKVEVKKKKLEGIKVPVKIIDKKSTSEVGKKAVEKPKVQKPKVDKASVVASDPAKKSVPRNTTDSKEKVKTDTKKNK